LAAALASGESQSEPVMAKWTGDRGSWRLQYVPKGWHMASSFEQMVKKLGLSPEEYESSALLKDWVRRNMDEKYVPSDLLKTWGFEKDEPTKEEAA
jgi:hypothetical protein